MSPLCLLKPAQATVACPPNPTHPTPSTSRLGLSLASPPGLPSVLVPKGHFSGCLSDLCTGMQLLKAVSALGVASLPEQASPCQSHLKAPIPPNTLLKPLQTNVIRGAEGSGQGPRDPARRR